MNANGNEQSAPYTADVAVIGAGSSGAVVAARLVEAGATVVLIEAGPDYGPFTDNRWPKDLLNAHAIATSHDWGYASGPIAGRDPITFERARVMGGCSAHNGAIAAVGHATDYDGWGLPLWRTDLLRPVFATALEKMRVRTYEPDEVGPFHQRCLDAAAAAGWNMAQDLCDLDANTSFGRESVNIVDRVRWNTAFAYLDAVRTHSNLQIVDNVLVDRLVEAASSVAIHGVRNGQPIRIDADRVVVSAGVYGSPAILQRSGIGDPDRLRKAGIAVVRSLPGVGANLHDHPMVHADRMVGTELQNLLEGYEARGALPEEQTLGKACSSLGADGVFDLHLFPVCASTQTTLTNGRALVEVACVTPKSRGRVDVLGPDPAAAPRIDHRYLTDPDDHDLIVLRDGLVLAEELLQQPALASSLGDRVTDMSTDADIRRNVVHYYHPVGTCAMGIGEMAVCDERGRLHGSDRIVVADASVIPTIPRANTNIPAVVIGERIATLLLEQR
jgi:choline dehydrogenase